MRELEDLACYLVESNMSLLYYKCRELKGVGRLVFAIKVKNYHIDIHTN
jgi:hypothetical protein